MIYFSCLQKTEDKVKVMYYREKAILRIYLISIYQFFVEASSI